MVPQYEPPDLSYLSTHDRALAESFAREMLSAEDSRGLPLIENYLARSRSPDRSELFRGLLRIEWRRMLQRSERPNAVSYVVRFPQFDAVVLRLAETELGRGQAGQLAPGPKETEDDPQRPIVASTLDETPSGSNAPGGTVRFDPHAEGSTIGDEPPQLPPSMARYTIQKPLGQGRYGRVYLARDDVLNRNVAIKVSLTPQGRNRSVGELLSEARRLAQLRHQNIVTVFDAEVSGTSVYIISDYVVGVDLRQWLRDNQPPWTTTARIAAMLADALGYAHAASTIHRDVKPANIILTSGDRSTNPEKLVPILVDFGLAISESESGRQQRGMVAGSPAYMSPEQVRGLAHRIDGRTDTYSLGVILYEMLCGRLPFRAAEFDELARQICLDAPQPPRQLAANIPPALEDLCLKAIAKNVETRYSTAGDMAEQLRAVLASEAAMSRSDSREASASGLSRWSPRPVKSDPPLASLEASSSHSSRFERVDQLADSRIQDAERRQLTAVYCRVLNATELAEQFDPEEERELLHDYQQACHAAARHFGGTIERQLGEDILIYFGYPLAQEDAGLRAVRTGIEFLRKIGQLNRRLRRQRGAEVTVGVAAHTSEVVAEETSEPASVPRMSVVGNAPRVASALSEHADGKCVLLTAATCGLLRGEFSTIAMGKKTLSGFRNPVETFAVLGEDESAAGLVSSRDIELVGRSAEADLLLRRWATAQTGSGQVGLLCGEAGIGKSRQLRYLKSCIRQEPHIWLEYRCSAYHTSSALYPIINLYQKVLKLDRAKSSEEKLGRLEELLRDYNLPLRDYVPILAPLLSIPLGPGYAPLTLTSEQRKRKTIEALVAIPMAMAEQQPVLLVVEDLHWADPSTRDFLGQLIDRARLTRLMIVFTFRPDFHPNWPIRPHLFQLTLSPLDREPTVQLATAIAGRQRLSAQILDYIVDRTDGVPIFVEELTRFLLDSEYIQRQGNEVHLIGHLDSLAIPTTLQDSLMARLDGLGSAKYVAQIGATLGREFSYDLLHAVAQIPEVTLQHELDRLVEADLFHQRGYPPRHRYLFKHTLVRDEAYHSLLRATREQHHHRIAQTLERQFPDTAAAEPELLAHHYSEANLLPQAIDYWWKAGSQARQRSAYAEAISHIKHGLKLIASLPASAERDRLELKFQISLGVSHVAASGYAAREVGEIFQRASDLAENTGDEVNHFFVLRMTFAWRVVRAEFGVCRQLADEVQRLSRQHEDPGILLEGHFAQALTRFYRGDFSGSRDWGQQGLEIYDEQRSQQIAAQTGQNSGVTIRCYLAWSLWFLGYPDQALGRLKEAVQLARRLEHPYSLAYAVAHLGRLQDYFRLGDEVNETGGELVELGREYGFPFWEAIGYLEIGRGLLNQGRCSEAIEETRRGLEIHNRTGAQLSMPYHHGLFAEAHLRLGQFDLARQALDDAWSVLRTSEENAHASELHRLEGEYEHAAPGGDTQKSRACFLKAIEIAGDQRAKSLELRAALSFATARPDGDGEHTTTQTLAEILDWFSEGLELPDQKQARKLLTRE